jgi:hypothetical protein
MIHGNSVSIGCLAMGDQVAEDLFILAADSDWRSAEVLIAPVDFRSRGLPQGQVVAAAWIEDLYGELRRRLGELQSGPTE